MRALQYEGTRAEVAQGFKERGNEMVKEKRWKDAKEFYTQGLGALSVKSHTTREASVDGGKRDMKAVSEEDKEAERLSEKGVEEALYVNRALCNLELSTFPSFQHLIQSLTLNPQKTTAPQPSTAPRPSA